MPAVTKKSSSFHENSPKTLFEDERRRKSTCARGKALHATRKFGRMKYIGYMQRLGECTRTSYLPTSRQSCHSYLGHKIILKLY